MAFEPDQRTEAEISALVDRFCNGTEPRFILGCNDLSAEVAEHLSITAFIDDFSQEASFNDRPIIGAHEIPPGALVLSAVTAISPLSARKRLRDLGCIDLDYFSFLRLSGLPLRGIPYWDGSLGRAELESAAYRQLAETLSDEESVDCLRRVVGLRATLSLDEMVPFTRREHQQYFEPFLELGSNEVFCDVGSFDGFTTEQFITLVEGKYDHIHVFEPIPMQRQQIEERLHSSRRLTVWPYALGSGRGEVRFSSSGSASRFDPQGDIVVQIRSLDDLGIEGPTLIKVDVEGHERDFIEGARETLRTFRPKVAIAAYHRWDDLYVLSAALVELLAPCKVFLRHYTEGYTETDLFVVPE